MSPRTGRPKSDNPNNSNLCIRVTKEEKEEIMNFSQDSGYTLLEIIRIGIEKIRGKKDNRNALPSKVEHIRYFLENCPKRLMSRTEKRIVNIESMELKEKTCRYANTVVTAQIAKGWTAP